MMVMVLIARLVGKVKDGAGNEHKCPAHIQGPEGCDVFVAEPKDYVGEQGHQNSRQGNKLKRVHILYIIYF